MPNAYEMKENGMSLEMCRVLVGYYYSSSATAA